MNKQQARRRDAARTRTPGQLDATPTGAIADAADNLEHDDAFSREDAETRQQQAEEERQAKLDAFASALAKKRTAAVDARRASGIEDVWREDEEFYEGIDAANRNESVTLKPRDTGGSASLVSDAENAGGTSSTLFLNITRAYVDFSAGRAADMLLPTDDLNWDLQETPMPDIIKAFGDATPLDLGPNAAPGAPATMGEAAKQMYDEAKAQVEKAKKRIEDWHEEGQFSAEQRKLLRDAAKVGTGILKGPYPVKKVARSITRDKDTGKIALQVQNKTAPISKTISYWNFYPDAACGDDIHKGNYTWEKDTITARQLRDLKGTKDADGVPMYIESAITTCLTEGPQRRYDGDTSYYAPDSETFEIWYFHGSASADDLAVAGVDVDEGEVVPVVITMVNDRVIKAALSTLESGDFPYDVEVWQEREGHWAGIGVARQVRTPQRMLNAAVRNMMDNAGLGAGPQVVMSNDIVPAAKNDNYSIRPRKFWKLKGDASIDDVRKAFAAIEIPMVTAELMTIVQLALKMAEDVTGLPMLLQGQQGQASDTVGGMQLLTNNSNTPLRAIAKQHDDRITVPHVLRYYEWLLLYGPEEDEKGEFVLMARGSSALFERDAQNQAILAMAPIIDNPNYKINPEKWIAQALKAQRLDPANFQYSEAEWAKRQEELKNQPPPQDPRLEAAKIAADARLKAAEITAEVQKDRTAKDTDRDTVYVQAQKERDQNAHDATMAELALRRELAMMDYANQHQLTLEQVKAKLAETAMKLDVQRELSHLDRQAGAAKPEQITPPTEPAGKAPAGESFEA